MWYEKFLLFCATLNQLFIKRGSGGMPKPFIVPFDFDFQNDCKLQLLFVIIISCHTTPLGINGSSIFLLQMLTVACLMIPKQRKLSRKSQWQQIRMHYLYIDTLLLRQFRKLRIILNTLYTVYEFSSHSH